MKTISLLLKQAYRLLISFSLLFMLPACILTTEPENFIRSSDGWNRPIPYLTRIKNWQLREKAKSGTTAALQEDPADEIAGWKPLVGFNEEKVWKIGEPFNNAP